MSVLIAPSILSADFAALGDAIAAAERGGADLIHVDVMDGHFVPNIISVHVEVLPHLHRTIHAIKALGAKAGVVLNPSTPVGALTEIAGDVDFVLVMSVNPGFGGQTFIPRSESKVREVRALLDRAGNSAAVEIDGGIDTTNVGRVVSAGARIIVAGSAVFHSPDPERATRELKAAALAGLPSAAVPR